MGGQNVKENNISNLINLIWLDPNVYNSENNLYQDSLKELNKFKLFTYTQTKDCLSRLKTIYFQKTFIIMSGSISQEFFIEFEKIMDEILVCPIIMIFTSVKKFNSIKKNIISLDKFSLFNMNLVFAQFNDVKNELLLENKYIPNYIPPDKYEENEICFSFEYISESRDLILPLTFMEFMENPNKFEVLEFNEYLLDKYSNNIHMENLIQQLMIDVKIPLQILVKYWVRAYTFETSFYKEMNNSLMRKTRKEFDIFIRILYYGLINKIIEPLINQKLYRGALIKKEEIKYIENSLKNKKENLPGCICYSKAFLSSSLDSKVAIDFLIKKIPKDDEFRVLYEFEKPKNEKIENPTNADIQKYSYYQKEKEILFFPYSCFEIAKIKKSQEYLKVYLKYIGEYRDVINKYDKIPNKGFTKEILSSETLDKIEMGKEANKDKFDFLMDQYIPKELKQSYIFATYEITNNDINKKIQILNCDEKINKNEIKKICNIYFNDKKIDFTFEYIFDKPDMYCFMFEFTELLNYANKLFFNCSNLIILDFRKFKSNYIKDMTDMFNGCINLQSLDLSNFRTKEVTSLKNTFKNCKSIKALDLSAFDTINVKDMSELFSECSSLTILNLLNFKTKNVKSTYRMFYKCNSLFYINISQFELNDNINTENMFYECPYFTSLKNEFVSKLTNEDISSSLEMVFVEFLVNQSLIISNDIQKYIKSKKYEKIEILNQSIEEFINNFENINILVIGEKEKKNQLISVLRDSFQSQYLKLINIEEQNNDIDKTIQNINNIINDNKSNLKSNINFLLLCFSEPIINDYMKNILKKLIDINKNKNMAPLFIIYLNSNKNDNFIEFKNNFSQIYTNPKFEIINVLLEEKEGIDEINTKIKNNFINLLYKNIHEDLDIMKIVKNKLDNIELEKNLNDLPNVMSKYFEKLLGKRDDIAIYINGYLKTLLNISKNQMKADTITNIIDRFKIEKLKLKIKSSKKIDIENLNDELSKDLKNKYLEGSKEFYENKYEEEIFDFFKDFFKVEAKNIIEQSIKNLKLEEFKPFIKKFNL